MMEYTVRSGVLVAIDVLVIACNLGIPVIMFFS